MDGHQLAQASYRIPLTGRLTVTQTCDPLWQRRFLLDQFRAHDIYTIADGDLIRVAADDGHVARDIAEGAIAGLEDPVRALPAPSVINFGPPRPHAVSPAADDSGMVFPPGPFGPEPFENAPPGGPEASFPPGWHSDPAQPGLLRWWDGTQWTQHQMPSSVQSVGSQ